MNKIIKFHFSFFIFVLYILHSNAAITDRLFATVGNKPITVSDIENEVKAILILTNTKFTEDSRQRLQSAAILSVISRNIKKIELEKYELLQFNKIELESEIKNLASRSNLTVDLLKDAFENNDLDFSLVIDRVKTEILWNGLIFSLYNDRLSINNIEIEEQLKLIQKKKEFNEFLISEIILKPIPSDQIDVKIEEFRKKIELEGFEKVALDLSISESSINGGDLGWINENSISDDFKSKIINTKVGNIAEPIFLPQGILFFKIRDKRKKSIDVDLEKVKTQLVNAEKDKILKMHSLSHYENVRRTLSVIYY